MEVPEFDANLGGNEHLPYSANSLKFAASRSIEIAAMTESILRPSKTKLIFQTLPVHMRRRVMSHNCKRLPRKLREGHIEQLKKSGLPPAQKRPSRKYRRRPANLLNEYNRRQQRNVWLETHIWHAKRFHMTERWGYKLPYAPCDKAFRACYRATSSHCLLQDVSYYTPILIKGTINDIRNMFHSITNSHCGLGICAKAYTTGKRKGSIHIFKQYQFPFAYIGRVEFLWVPSESSERKLYLFVHPSQLNDIKLTLKDACINAFQVLNDENSNKRRKVNSSDIELNILSESFSILRLTGPNSHAVLSKSLKCIEDITNIKSNEWVSLCKENSDYLHFKEKYDYWKSLNLISSPSQLSSGMILGLVVRDPRLSRPLKRTKAVSVSTTKANIETLLSIPQSCSASPLWETHLHNVFKKNRKSNHDFIQHITKTQLVPGEINETDPALQCIPIVLIQRPGSQNSTFKKIGYGCGWDIILPSGYGLPFWQTFIMFGARSGGLRETENLAFEMGETYLPPDSKAGREEEKRIELEMKDRYFRLPPSKRVNYIKLAINSPFVCPWRMLLSDWKPPDKNNIDNIFVLRHRNILSALQDCITKIIDLPEIEYSQSCLIPVYVQILGKGNLRRNALICLPQTDDLSKIKTLFEPHHDDPNAILRKQKRIAHKKNIKKSRKKKMQMKIKTQIDKQKTNQKRSEISEYVKSMRELWLPSTISTARHSCSRQVLGYVAQGAFTFTEAQCCGVGYVTYNGLKALLISRQNKILIRNTSSRKYRIASIQIILN